MRHSQQALAPALQSPFGLAQPPGYRSTPPTPIPGAVRGRCHRSGIWKQESKPDRMTSLTAGRKGSPPACLPRAKHSSMPPLLSSSWQTLFLNHDICLSFSWSMADISNQTRCFSPVFAHFTPHLARPCGSTGQMLEERTRNSIFPPT